MTDTSKPEGSDLPTPPGHVDPDSDPQDPVQPGGPVPPGAPTGPGGPTEPDVTPDQPSQPGGPGDPSPEPNAPSPSEPTVPTPTEPTVPDPSGPPSDDAARVLNVPGTADMPATDSTSSGSGGSSGGAGGEGDERFVRGEGVGGSDANLGALAQDVAHPFDQTNGILEELEGDADDPDRVEERLGGENVFERAFSDREGGDDFGREEEIDEDEGP
jgi:hypothetical protein